MNYLNGIPEPQTSRGNHTISEFWELLPNPPEEDHIQRIESKIKSMRNKYRFYRLKNSLLSTIAKLNTDLKYIQDEIDRI